MISFSRCFILAFPFVAFEKMPAELVDDYTVNGKCPVVEDHYFSQRYDGAEAQVSQWTEVIRTALVKIF